MTDKVIKKGFTLIELMVVMGIMAVLAAGVVALINPADKIKSANDATLQSGVGEAATASQSYAARNGGLFPFQIGDLKTYGDLSTVPVGITVTGSGGANCNATATPPSCDSAIVYASLTSQKYSTKKYWRYSSTDNKTCAVAALTDACL